MELIGDRAPKAQNEHSDRNMKRKPLAFQGDFDKIVDIGKTELCFLSI